MAKALSPTLFWKHWKKAFPEARQAKTLLAVSGGLDSMTLATLFLACNIPFEVAHVNYGLRGADSDADEELISAWCHRQGILCHILKAPLSKDEKGIQEKARKARYEWFEKLCAERNIPFIATAHHANDVAETMLMNLAKGTGIKGLHGILPRQKNILRPLLAFTKKELEAFCKEHQVPFREDESNTKSDYLRNYFRHQIIPAIEHQIPDTVKQILDTALRMQATEKIFREAVAKQLQKLITSRGTDFYLPIRKLQNFTGYEALLYEWLQAYHFSGAQMHDVYQLLKAHGGRYVESETHRLIKDREFLILTKKQSPDNDFYLIENMGQCLAFSNGTIDIERYKETQIPEEIDANTCYVDEASIVLPLTLRRWRRGDYFYPIGMNGKKKKVARLLIDLKIPVHEKEQVWVVAYGEKIVWVVGHRTDNRFKATTHSKSLFRLHFTAIKTP